MNATVVVKICGAAFYPVSQEEEDRRSYLILLCCLLCLLLLLLMLGIFYGFSSSANEGKETEETEGGNYVVPKSPTTPQHTRTTIEMTKQTERTTRETTAATTETSTTTTSSTTTITTSTTTTSTTTTSTTTTTTTTTSTSTTTTTTTSTTTRKPSTGYGYMVCAFGHEVYLAALFPIKQELCDFIVFTHVVVYNSTLTSETGLRAYTIFTEVATLHKDDRHTRFGLSYSPTTLSQQLSSKEDAQTLTSRFLKAAQDFATNASLSAFGTMGLERSVQDIAHDPKLVAWHKSLAHFVKTLRNGTLFLGLRLIERGADLSSKQKLATDVFQTLRDMEVKLLVLVTHNIADMGISSCASLPVSSWSAKVYQDPTKPALEHMFNFLKFALMGETKIEVALSSTCVFMAFRMKKAVSGPIKFGEGCVANYPLPFEARCIKKPPNEQEHGDSLTAVAFSGTTLYSFETAESVKKKLRRFIMPLDDLVFRRVGWAFFDSAFETYNNCSGQSFPRLTAAKEILEENRNRKFIAYTH
ncbi:uncharacterized protein LOC144108726 [Amblyomma americanum]